MKFTLQLSTLLLCLFLFSCSKSDNNSYINVSPAEIQVNANESAASIHINSSNRWQATLNATWCKLDKMEGTTNSDVVLTIEANDTQASRTAQIIFTSDGEQTTVSITQNGPENYSLPIIFHVLYKYQNDPTQYVSSERLAEILEQVNALVKKSSDASSVQFEYILATTDPNGKTLATPGVEYIPFDQIPMNPERFMNDNTSKYTYLLWDPNKYINVMMYQFSDNQTLGISHLPFTTKGDYSLPGLNETTYTTLSLSNLKFPYSVSINSSYINSRTTDSKYDEGDIVVTLTHELGHYLGLHHVFSESDNSCDDTDYCNDTPSYNRLAYENDVRSMMPINSIIESWSKLVARTNCSGGYFESNNIMDYSYSNFNTFTAEQYKRIHNVLNYSPLIPGPKLTKGLTRTTAEGPIDLPIQTIK
ncbi:MAG: zinc-dependent metalloproteinase lipoprotein [Tannerellaceae bacterium]